MSQTVAVGTKFMLEVNAAAILSRVRAARRTSVSSLAKETGLSRQAITRSLSVLESMGMVEMTAPDRDAAPAGRPPQMVRFRAEAGHLVGVDVQPRAVRVAVSDLSGDILAESTRAIAPGAATPIAEILRSAVADALALANVAPESVWHVSAAAAGIVDPVTGHVVLSPSMPEVVGDTIVRGIRAAVDAPVYVDNDVKLATQGERGYGAPHAEDALVFVDWGERIGAGIVLRGELYRGASNDAGDLGYLDLVAAAQADLAQSDDLGPFERWVGARALSRAAADASGTGDADAYPIAEVIAAAVDGADWAVQAVRTICARFAKGIAAIRSLLDPEVVVIGGDMAALGPLLIELLDEALRAEPLAQPRIEISRLGADAIIRGALYHSLAWAERERFGGPALRLA